MSAEVHKGGNRLLCNGRCIMTRNILPLLCTLTTLLVCSCLFFAVDCPVLANSISPCVPLAGALLAAFVFSCLITTAFTDPGIVPRPQSEEAAHYKSQRPDERWVRSDRRKIIIRGTSYEQKFCVTCRLWRPPRAAHCSRCDNCVLRFDHHCVWVGNCIGARNYRHFLMFIVGLQVYSVFVLVFSLYHLLGPPAIGDHRSSIADRLSRAPTSLVNAIVAAGTACSMVILLVYHVKMVCNELTTSEDTKQTFVISSLREDDQTIVNPFDFGCPSNCSRVLCGPVIPSLLRRDGGDEAQNVVPVLQPPAWKMRRQSQDSRSELLSADAIEQCQGTGEHDYRVSVESADPIYK